MNQTVLRKIFVLALGFFVTSLGTSCFIGSNMGCDSYTLMVQGVSKMLGVSVGMGNTVMSLLFIVIVLLADRTYVRWGTVVSLVVVGPSIDFWSWLCRDIYGFMNQNIPLRMVCLLVAIVVVALGVSIVMSAHLGTHINDAIPVLLSKSVGKRWQFRVSKIGWDLSQLVVGVLMGGVFGVGTVLSALLLGPVLQCFIPKVDGFVEAHVTKTGAGQL